MRREEEARRKEDAAKWRKEEDELMTMTKQEERISRSAQEKAMRQALGSSRHERSNKATSEADDTVQLEATKTDVANRPVEAESAALQHNSAECAGLDPGDWKRDRTLEQRYLEEKRLEEDRLQREREEQIRLDEELGQVEQARLDHEALIKREREQEEQSCLTRN